MSIIAYVVTLPFLVLACVGVAVMYIAMVPVLLVLGFLEWASSLFSEHEK